MVAHLLTYNLNKSIIIFSLILPFSQLLAANSPNILDFKECPNKVRVGLFMDGGTQLVKIYDTKKHTYYIGIDNPMELSVNNSEKTLTQKELDYIEENKKIRLFINGIHPKRGNVRFLLFKGKEESFIKAKMESWLKCDSLSKEEKDDIRDFLLSMSQERFRKIIFEQDVEDRALEKWRNNHLPTKYFSHADKFILAKIKIIDIKKKKLALKLNKGETKQSWYVLTFKVLKSFDGVKLLDNINVLSDNDPSKESVNHQALLVLLSRIEDPNLSNQIDAQYFLHEISEPEEIYCFKNDIKRLKLDYTQIESRVMGSWKKQCFNNSDLNR